MRVWLVFVLSYFPFVCEYSDFVIITSGAPGDEFVRIDGKRTYFDIGPTRVPPHGQATPLIRPTRPLQTQAIRPSTRPLQGQCIKNAREIVLNLSLVTRKVFRNEH